jgi:transcriptional regulator with XRE-family HTH domain
MDLELGLDDLRSDEDEGPMVEAIDAGKIVTVSEDHALREGLPILKHLAEQAVEADEPAQGSLMAQDAEKDLLLRMTEMKQAADQAGHPMKKELLPHWHWHISQARRRKGLTRKQFGQVSGVSEQQLKLLENGILPPNASMLITKVQDGLGVRLRRDMSSDTAQPMRELVELQDSAGKEIDSEEKLLKEDGKSVGGGDIELLED